MRLLAALATFAIACALGAATHAHAVPSPSWAAPEIERVVGAGILGSDVASFRPDDPLTRGELHEAILALGKPHLAPTEPDRIVTMRELDAQLVGALRLVPSSSAIRLSARAAGLEPTGMLGTETVARILGLRINHPQEREALERRPGEAATRAEAAYSFAHLIALDPWRLADAQAIPQSFALPELDDWQRQVLSRALKLVGYPYVFAGTSEKRVQKLWTAAGQVDAPGGFDCSGLVWRVYKLEPYPGGDALAGVFKGRTSYAMSGEVPVALRLPLAEVQAGDVLFFGAKGPKSKPSQVGHMGIAVAPGWFVHSSGNGVTLQPLTGWYQRSFAWARRPLAEAGLEPAA
ncbi:MAG: NlpC/P60 family protein [Gaiellales bacterium]